jgi:trimeric autotransporter adhesin
LVHAKTACEVNSGQASYTTSSGATGTVANMVLAAEGHGYGVTQTSSTDAQGARTVITKCYGASGELAYAFTSVTSATGNTITNSYDDNGDGVLDRLQTLVKSTDAQGVKTEALTNRDGGGILANSTTTVTSADGRTITISRDSQGGGWTDQREYRLTYADGTRSVSIYDLNADGTVIGSSAASLTADGLWRSEALDLDSNGSTDLTHVHQITINAGGSRTETFTDKNGDGSLRDGTVLTVSADGQTTTLASDLDGNGWTDRTEATSIVVAADGGTTSTDTVTNNDGSLRSRTLLVQSANALFKTLSLDRDGNNVYERITTDNTTINADQSRYQAISVYNGNGSLSNKTIITLGADKISGTTQVDQDGDSNWDFVRTVVVDGGGAKTDTSSAYNDDGSLITRSTAYTTSNGLATTIVYDLDGNGSTDVTTSDVKTFNGNQTSTENFTTYNGDSSLRGWTIVDTSANGLSVTTQTDIDGGNATDLKKTDVTTLNGNGSVQQVVQQWSANTTLLSKSTKYISSDRRTITVTDDANGDGADDHVLNHTVATNGNIVDDSISYNANGTIAYRLYVTTTANGLSTWTYEDADSNNQFETVTSDVIVLNANGSKTETIQTKNADNSIRSQQIATISDDGLVVTHRYDIFYAALDHVHMAA